jgi:hypothetical protein
MRASVRASPTGDLLRELRDISERISRATRQ